VKQKVNTKPENSINMDHVEKGLESKGPWETNYISRHSKQSFDFKAYKVFSSEYI